MSRTIALPLSTWPRQLWEVKSVSSLLIWLLSKERHWTRESSSKSNLKLTFGESKLSDMRLRISSHLQLFRKVWFCKPKQNAERERASLHLKETRPLISTLLKPNVSHKSWKPKELPKPPSSKPKLRVPLWNRSTKNLHQQGGKWPLNFYLVNVISTLSHNKLVRKMLLSLRLRWMVFNNKLTFH